MLTLGWLPGAHENCCGYPTGVTSLAMLRSMASICVCRRHLRTEFTSCLPSRLGGESFWHHFVLTAVTQWQGHGSGHRDHLEPTSRKRPSFFRVLTLVSERIIRPVIVDLNVLDAARRLGDRQAVLGHSLQVQRRWPRESAARPPAWIRPSPRTPAGRARRPPGSSPHPQ